MDDEIARLKRAFERSGDKMGFLRLFSPDELNEMIDECHIELIARAIGPDKTYVTAPSSWNIQEYLLSSGYRILNPHVGAHGGWGMADFLRTKAHIESAQTFNTIVIIKNTHYWANNPYNIYCFNTEIVTPDALKEIQEAKAIAAEKAKITAEKRRVSGLKRRASNLQKKLKKIEVEAEQAAAAAKAAVDGSARAK